MTESFGSIETTALYAQIVAKRVGVMVLRRLKGSVSAAVPSQITGLHYS